MKRRGFLLTGMVMSAVALAALIAPAQSQDPAPEVTPEATAEPTPFTLVLAKDGVCYVTPDESAVIIPGDGVYNLPDASLRFSLKATHVSPPIAYAAITPDSSKAYVPLDGLYDLTTGERLLDVAVSSGWIDTEGRYLELYDYDLRYYTLYDLTTMQEIPRAEADAIRDARAAASVPHPYSQTMDIYDPEKDEIRMTFSEDLSLYAAVTPTTLGVYTLPDRTKLFEAGLALYAPYAG